MRDIKFRVWDNDTDYMGYLYPDMTYMEGTGKWLIDDLGETLNMDDKTIELYTGITDINGVEIYEGDIIKFHVVMLCLMIRLATLTIILNTDTRLYFHSVAYYAKNTGRQETSTQSK